MIELVLSKLYTDIGEVIFALELDSLNKLTVSLLPSKRLINILQSILIHVEPGIGLIAPLKSEFMYIFLKSYSDYRSSFPPCNLTIFTDVFKGRLQNVFYFQNSDRPYT